MVNRRNDATSSDHQAQQDKPEEKPISAFVGFLVWIWRSIVQSVGTSHKRSDGNRETEVAQPKRQEKTSIASALQHAEEMNRIKYIKANNRLKDNPLLRLAVSVVHNNQEEIENEKVNVEKEKSEAGDELIAAIESGNRSLQHEKVTQLLKGEEKRIYTLLSRPPDISRPSLNNQKSQINHSFKQDIVQQTEKEISKLIYEKKSDDEYIYPTSGYIDPVNLGLEKNPYSATPSASSLDNSQNPQTTHSEAEAASEPDTAPKPTIKETQSKK